MDGEAGVEDWFQESVCLGAKGYINTTTEKFLMWCIQSRLEKNIQGWFPLGLTGLISLLSKGPSRVFLSTTIQFKSVNSLAFSLLYGPTLTSKHDYWKNHILTRWNFVGKVMSLFFNVLSWFVIAFLPRSKHLLLSWLQSPSAVILEPKKIKSALFPLFLHLPWGDGTRCYNLHLLNAEF